jgi:hypothetical protein
MADALVFIVIGLIYAVIKVYLEKRLAPLDAAGDECELSDVAFSSGNSVYEVFKTAATNWHVPDEKRENDFKNYLHQGLLPPYVRDHIRRHSRPGDRTYHKLVFSGGRPPYL